MKLNSRVLAGVLVGASLVGIGMSVWTQVDQHDSDVRRAKTEACYDEVFNQLVEVLQDTRDVAATERETQRKLYQEIRDDPAGFRLRLDDYLTQLSSAEAERSARPLPLPPKVTCGHDREE
ncbi:hypothetical protein GCM10010435_44550 [Winogradskya consettensis]|uniref:Uncharacterized protein n=1 Tax=Winogradskya consettensis TaxID=113560 RepID=A0A919T3A1_9ACTN|nr:hypothetical protein [Actinoplanes consettensis]GIM82722.1 hypothetical protein Aco04nite_82940 [Actinoplanes consettensis]